MTDDIGYINYTSLGNAVFFGDLTQVREVGSGASSPTRVLMIGGYINPGTNTNSCEYVQIMTTGNSKDFGDLNQLGKNYTSQILWFLGFRWRSDALRPRLVLAAMLS